MDKPVHCSVFPFFYFYILLSLFTFASHLWTSQTFSASSQAFSCDSWSSLFACKQNSIKLLPEIYSDYNHHKSAFKLELNTSKPFSPISCRYETIPIHIFDNRDRGRKLWGVWGQRRKGRSTTGHHHHNCIIITTTIMVIIIVITIIVIITTIIILTTTIIIIKKEKVAMVLIQ